MRFPPSQSKEHTGPRMIARTGTARIKVAIVEDDDELRANLSEYVGRFPDFKLVAAFADGEAALADLPRLKPEVVVMDINLPGIDGIKCVEHLRDSMPQTLFMMLTVYEDND